MSDATDPPRDDPDAPTPGWPEEFKARYAAATTPEAVAARIAHNDLTMKNTRIDGFGADVVTVIPCPFCGAAGMIPFPVTAAMDGYAELQKERTCQECKRSCRLVINRTPGGVGMTVVQTGGDDPPAWLWPPIRRVSMPAAAALIAAEDTRREQQSDGGAR